MKPKTPSNTQSGHPVGSKKPTVSAKSKATALLARREHSQTELRAKLLQRGYEVEEVEEAVQWAISHQFQSDDRFKLSLFRRRASTFGDRAISAELGQHGLGDIKSIETEEQSVDALVSEEDRAYDWIMRRKLSDLSAVFDEDSVINQSRLLTLKAKVFKGLSSRGFDFGNIDRAWRRIIAEFKSNA
ncbi:MAG: recombination regulator RecX [Gammaproteobacteria bacterium]|nr:recombination regulator RecX [Gammaproteobacteria bacterium]MBU0848930.1 recombination regulator RecX [Gammaproteobacteria bacterium]MBU1268258.1 recombination regulator RecX [Gammaproteobacteria bacterium]MBU1527815.1 recombination regulator RecX [Gammaproteobacteria bacterium]MBU1778857.1 recombination regulator RecX [Gammaproteobacteria bacterium]